MSITSMKRSSYSFFLLLSMVGLFFLAIGNAIGEDNRYLSSTQMQKNSSSGIELDKIKILDLKTAGEIALSNNPSLKAARIRIYQATEVVHQAQSSFWPRIDATGSGSKIKFSENSYQSNLASAKFIDPAATIENPEDYYNAGITGSWVLFDGFERKYSNALARYGEKASEFAEKDAERLLLSAISSSYFSAQLARENVFIAIADKEFNQRQFEEAKARRRVGTGSLSDVLNFEVRMNSAETALFNARYYYQTLLYSLAALMGIPDARLPSAMELARLKTETPEELAPPNVDLLISFANENRSDIRQYQLFIKQREADVLIARAKFFPKIMLSASTEGERITTANFETDDFGHSIAMGLSFNIFAGGLHRASFKEKKLKQTEAEKTLENLLINVAQEIRSLSEKVMTAQKQLSLQRKNASLVKKNRDLVEKEYAAGQGSLVRLNEAQKDLTSAQARLVLALVSLRQAWFEVDTSTGNIRNLF